MQVDYEPRFWRNGQLFTDDGLAPGLSGYGLGDGVFETIAFRQNELEFWGEHMARMRLAAAALGFGELPDSLSLEAAALGLLEDARRGQDYRVRVTASWTGHGPDITLGIAPLSPEVSAPKTLVLTDIIRPAGNPTTRFKTLAYTDNLAAQRGLATGQEALLLNQWGRVACSAFANVYAYINGVWVTPSVGEGALPGIIRGQVLAKAGNVLGIENLRGEPVVEGQVELADFLAAPLLMSNSVRGVLSCRMIP